MEVSDNINPRYIMYDKSVEATEQLTNVQTLVAPLQKPHIMGRGEKRKPY